MSQLRFYKTKTSVVFNLVFANNTILSCFFFFFLMIELYILISAVIAQTFDSTAELAMPTKTPISEANTEVETQLLKAESKIIKCSK